MADKKKVDKEQKVGKGERPYRRAILLLSLTIPTLLLLFAALLYYTLPAEEGQEADLRQFMEWTAGGDIESAVMLSEDNRVLFVVDGQQYWVGLPRGEVYLSTFAETVLAQGLALEVDQQTLKKLVEPITVLIPALVLACAFVLIFLIIRAGGSNPFLKAAAKRGAQERPVTFADVAGADEAILEIREVRDYLLDPARLEAIGAQAPRGVLLVGPPGTGKTLLARAVAGEAGVPFFSMSGTDFVEMWVGVGAARVRDLFRQVRERAPAILFIDELDALGRARSGGASSSGGSDERDQTLNQLLVEIDGFATTTGVVIIGATNRPDILDQALLRQGRFDRQIVVDRPDRAGRLAILRVHAANKRFEPSVDLERVAAQTTGFTGADLASVTNEAALLAARRGKNAIGLLELEEAIDRVLMGNEGRTRRLTSQEKRAVAYHEAGHAVVALARPGTSPVDRISIVSRGKSLGHTRRELDEDKALTLQSEMHQELSIIMAGRAGESLVLGEPTSTAKSDLRRATEVARRMVCEYGMSETLGQVALGRPGSSPYLSDGSIIADYSGEVAATIDREIRRLIGEAFEDAAEVLRTYREILDWLATELIAKETLRGPEIKPFAEAIAANGDVLSNSRGGAEPLAAPPGPTTDAGQASAKVSK